MGIPNRFEDLPVVGALPPEAAASRLAEVGEPAEPSSTGPRPLFFSTLDCLPFRERLWSYTSHVIGYLPLRPATGGTQPIRHAGDVEPDSSLRGARVRVSLDRLRVAQYPGQGAHRVLFDFSARNHIDDKAEELHFNAVYRVGEDEMSGVVGYPIFVGLQVGDEGLALRCYTVNVKNDQDESFLSFLESDTFRAGLRLLGPIQPALGLLSAMALNLTRAIAARNRNVPVQDFYLGLDFGATPLGLRLAEGNYLVAQVPGAAAAAWDWSEWAYDPRGGQVVGTGPDRRSFPYNYVAIGVSRHDRL